MLVVVLSERFCELAQRREKSLCPTPPENMIIGGIWVDDFGREKLRGPSRFISMVDY